MATKSDVFEFSGGGSFLSANVTARRVFTREDLSPAQQMFGRIAEDFMSSEVMSLTKTSSYLATISAVHPLKVMREDL